MPEIKEYYFEIKPKSSFTFSLKEFSEYKELFYFFTWRDVKVKYKQAVLGLIWAVVQPVIMTTIITFFVSGSVRLSATNMSYPAFAFSGLLLWGIFSAGVTNSANSMVTNAQIIKKIYFPRLIIPVSSILVAVFDFTIAFGVFIIFLFVSGDSVVVVKALLLWPLSVIIAILATLGPGCLLAALNVKYRDFRYVVPFVLQALLFLTPVIYPVSAISNPLVKYILALNPIFAPIALFRMPMHETFDISLFVISLFSNFAFLLGGFIYFRKTEMYFADLA